MELLDTTTLLTVSRVHKDPFLFWLTKGFTRQIDFTTDTISFDQVNEDYRRLAPFVAPNVQGRVLKLEGSNMLTFKPAYTKPKHIVDINMPFVRRAGEALGSGSLTPQQRHDAVVAEILGRQRAMQKYRQEWMAAQATIHGGVTVQGEDYPPVYVDFHRDASLTTTLLTTARWNQAGTSFPLADIKAKRVAANTLCGAVIRDIIFGADAWASFSAHATVTPFLDKMVGGSESNYTKLTDGFDDQVEYLGELKGVNGSGLLRLWLYNAKYKDENDVQQEMMPANVVVGVDWARLEGHRCFGAIRDGAAGFQAMEMFPKHWEDQDPWNEYLMTQSAPLMVPKQPNASFKIVVQ